MSAESQMHGWTGPSRRRTPRYRVQASLDVTVLRSGIPDTVPGRSVNLCERGLAAMLAADLMPGEAVGIEVWLPLAADCLRTRALVRYQDKLRYGMEFVGLSAEQRAAIRDWAGQSKAEMEPSVGQMPPSQPRKEEGNEGARSGTPGGPSRKRRGRGWAVLLVLLAVAGLIGAFWWRWNRGWQELEAGLPNHERTAEPKPPIQVPADVMEKLLVHRVDPEYPAAARQERLRGVVALDVVVGQDGSVVEMRPLNGPDVLAHSAMEALRWWRFEPYRVNGEPVRAETTIAMEFKP